MSLKKDRTYSLHEIQKLTNQDEITVENSLFGLVQK